MAEKKPLSIKEFKMCVIDGFSIAKIDKFAAFFIDGIAKFMNNEFSLSYLLPTYHYKAPASKFSPQEKRQFNKMLQSNQSLISISHLMSRPESEIIDEIVFLIRTGSPITKTHLANLVGANDETLKYLKKNLTSDDLSNLDNIPLVKEKFVDFPNITEQMLVLVLNYLKVRHFLRVINVPFFDVDENQLVNGFALLESKSIEKINSNPSQSQTKTNEVKLLSFGGESSSQKPNGSFSSSQNSQSSQVFDLLQEDEEDFAAIVASYDSKTEEQQVTAAKPLHDSQKPNQYDEIKKLDVKPATKVPLIQTKIGGSVTANGRKRAVSKYTIQYDSDSDSDAAASKSEPQTKRALPQWMTTKKSANSTAQSNSVRKKSFF